MSTLCDPVDCNLQSPLSMGSSRQEHWSGLPFPSPSVVFHMCPSQSLNSSHPTFPLGIHMFVLSVLYVCVSISALWIRWPIAFFRFHIYALTSGICFFLSDLLHSIWQTPGPPTSLQKAPFHSFLWLSNIPLVLFSSPIQVSELQEGLDFWLLVSTLSLHP